MEHAVRVSRFRAEADSDEGGEDMSPGSAQAALRAFAREDTDDLFLVADTKVDVLLTFARTPGGLRLDANFPGAEKRRFFMRFRPQRNVVIDPIDERRAERLIERLAWANYSGLASELGQPWS